MEEENKLLKQMVQMLAVQNGQLVEQNRELTAKIDILLARIDELTAKKNSRNSSVPPSSDGYAKPAPKSQRKSSGAKPGGQDGHKGSSMKLMKEPDEVKEHYPTMCTGCPNCCICHTVLLKDDMRQTLS